MVAPPPGTVHKPAPPPPSPRPRKVVQITAAPWDGSVALNALCDDGTMWEMNAGRWVELPAIPQDESQDPLAVAVGTLQTIRLRAEAWLHSSHSVQRRLGETILEILKGKQETWPV